MSQPRSPRWVCSMTVGMRNEDCSAVMLWLVWLVRRGAPGRYNPAALSVLWNARLMICSPSRNGTSTLHGNVCFGHEQVKGFLLPQLVPYRVQLVLLLKLGLEPLRVFVPVLGHLGQPLLEVGLG